RWPPSLDSSLSFVSFRRFLKALKACLSCSSGMGGGGVDGAGGAGADIGDPCCRRIPGKRQAAEWTTGTPGRSSRPSFALATVTELWRAQYRVRAMERPRRALERSLIRRLARFFDVAALGWDFGGRGREVFIFDVDIRLARLIRSRVSG